MDIFVLGFGFVAVVGIAALLIILVKETRKREAKARAKARRQAGGQKAAATRKARQAANDTVEGGHAVTPVAPDLYGRGGNL